MQKETIEHTQEDLGATNPDFLPDRMPLQSLPEDYNQCGVQHKSKWHESCPMTPVVDLPTMAISAEVPTSNDENGIHLC